MTVVLATARLPCACGIRLFFSEYARPSHLDYMFIVVNPFSSLFVNIMENSW